ncbi:MAG: CHAT domain-containing protein [bacterium]|nr:CHAT domain-containing protein [bacterium]
MKPVIVLAFANDKDNYLPMIARENKNLYKSLQTHHDNGYIQLHREVNTSVEDIFQTFNDYPDRIAIFHYGGHAGGTHLQLETVTGESQPAFAPGLAELLGQQNQLQLVFLNGCATLKQVEQMHSAGVKAVIATTVPIEDKTATEFAEQFYYALAAGAAVQVAFDRAKAFIKTRYGKRINRYAYRAVHWAGKDKAAKPEPPWGLYFDENSPEGLQWKLPTSNRDSIIIRGGSASTPGVNVNTLLMETLFNEITAYGKEKPAKMDWRKIRKAVIDGFPVPVGEQLRLLFFSNTIDVQRLKQLVITYQITMEMICFTLMSQLWDARIETPDLVIHEDYLTVFNSFFTLGPESVATYDYVTLTAALLGIFEENGIDCFIAEFSTLKENLRPEDEFYKSHLFMEAMKREIREDRVKADEIEEFCKRGEAHLGTILKRLAFLVNYRMSSVKTIEVIKRRHKEAYYNHNNVYLDRITEGLADEPAAFKTFTDNSSVIFLDNRENDNEVAGYLSLSPFIIDENALTGDECSKLFFYSHREEVQGEVRYVYTFVDNPEESLVISDDKYPQVKELMEEFKERTLCLPVP